MEAQPLRVAERVGGWLPRGRPLDQQTWHQRHRTVCRLLWVQTGALGLYGVIRGYPAAHLALEVTALAALGVAAVRVSGRRAQAITGTLGLVSCSALLVHLSGGLIEAHFHFFIMLGVVTLYQDWLAFGVAMVYIVIHHGTVGVLDPHSVYNHYAAINRPWLWAGVHAAFVTGAAVVGIRSWKYAEVERERAEDAAVRLYDRNLRQREAIQLNDTVVQGLVTAKYAAQCGDSDAAEAAVDRTLALAQSLVSDLMASDPDLFEPGGLRRVAPQPLSAAP